MPLESGAFLQTGNYAIRQLTLSKIVISLKISRFGDRSVPDSWSLAKPIRGGELELLQLSLRW